MIIMFINTKSRKILTNYPKKKNSVKYIKYPVAIQSIIQDL